MLLLLMLLLMLLWLLLLFVCLFVAVVAVVVVVPILKKRNSLNFLFPKKYRGTLQFHGLSVAIRVLFTAESGSLKGLHLTRNDVVALFNLLERLSSSISYVHEMEALVVANPSLATSTGSSSSGGGGSSSSKGVGSDAWLF